METTVVLTLTTGADFDNGCSPLLRTALCVALSLSPSLPLSLSSSLCLAWRGRREDKLKRGGGRGEEEEEEEMTCLTDIGWLQASILKSYLYKVSFTC
jgi:hypothetical protein